MESDSKMDTSPVKFGNRPELTKKDHNRFESMRIVNRPYATPKSFLRGTLENGMACETLCVQ